MSTLGHTVKVLLPGCGHCKSEDKCRHVCALISRANVLQPLIPETWKLCQTSSQISLHRLEYLRIHYPDRAQFGNDFCGSECMQKLKELAVTFDSRWDPAATILCKLLTFCTALSFEMQNQMLAQKLHSDCFALYWWLSVWQQYWLNMPIVFMATVIQDISLCALCLHRWVSWSTMVWVAFDQKKSVSWIAL